MEAGLMILLFFGVIFITLVVFAVWIAFVVVRGGVRLITGLGGGRPKAQPMLMLTRCVNERCRSTNAPHARFCRRCGAVLSDPRRYATPRLAG